jgi:hypothetical protein
MASVVIAGIKNDIQCVTQTTPCSSFIFITYKLYQGLSLYTSFSTTAPSYTFNDVPVGFDYYVQIEIYTAGPTLCDSATSNTITLTSYCIPSNATNISFNKLREFYDLNSFDVLLSGPNNPSSGNSIFGKSSLPNTGTPSKTRPNAVSELRSYCNGVIPWESSVNELGINLVSSNSMTLSAEVRDNSSNTLWSSNSSTTSGCQQIIPYVYFNITDTDSKFTATITRTGSIVGNMNLIILRLDGTPTVVRNSSYSVNTSNSYSQTVTDTLNISYPHRYIAVFRESSCDPIV